MKQNCISLLKTRIMKQQKSVSRNVVITAVAREFGMPPSTVRNLFDGGKLPLTNDKLAIAKALIDWFNSKERDLSLKREMAESDPQYQANLRLTREKADRQAMENAVMAGELVNTATVAQVLGDLLGVLRQRLLVMPSKLSHPVIECKDRAEAEFLISSYILDALNEITSINITDSLTAGVSRECSASSAECVEVSGSATEVNH